MRIGLDFDRVLFKTDKFKQHLFERFDDFRDTYQEAVVDGVYDPEKHAEKMDVAVEEIYDEFHHASKFLYNDVKRLEELEEFKLIIISRGDPVFQKKKIEESGILKIVDNYEVLQNGSKDEAVNIDFLVDDLEKELQKVNVPGFKFNRDKHSIQDIIDKVREQNEARKSV